MDKNQKSAFNMRCKFMGMRLMIARYTKFNRNPVAFTQWLSPEDVLAKVKTGVRVYKPLWMDLLTAMTGKQLPNGNHDFDYISFWAPVFPKNKRYYILKHKNGSMEFCSF